jgi:hypothetical protein
METVYDKWCSFDMAVIPEDAPRIQRQEMRRAFYAGVLSAMNLFAETADDDDVCGKQLDAIEQECRDFMNDMLEGKR